MRHALMIEGRALIPAKLTAITHALDATVPDPTVSSGLSEGHMRPRIWRYAKMSDECIHRFIVLTKTPRLPCQGYVSDEWASIYMTYM
jgi:hypothetical protein